MSFSQQQRCPRIWSPSSFYFLMFTFLKRFSLVCVRSSCMDTPLPFSVFLFFMIWVLTSCEHSFTMIGLGFFWSLCYANLDRCRLTTDLVHVLIHLFPDTKCTDTIPLCQCCNRVRLESHTRTLPVTRAVFRDSFPLIFVHDSTDLTRLEP